LEGISQRVPFGLLALSVVGFFTIGLLEGTLGWNTVLMSTIGFDLTALGAFSLIWLALIPRCPAQVICQAAPLRFFGRYSYGMYVYHQVLQSYMMKYIFPATTRLFHSQVLGAIGYFVCVLFEIRFLRMKRLFRSGAYSRAELGAPNLPAIASETKSY
jgi:peptidoglycan/LPS O-acetylase OafA/YrhL